MAGGYVQGHTQSLTVKLVICGESAFTMQGGLSEMAEGGVRKSLQAVVVWLMLRHICNAPWILIVKGWGPQRSVDLLSSSSQTRLVLTATLT